jgi:arylsulfatase A-like enzyme
VNGSRNTPLRGSKCETFEGGIRVPLLMQWPGVIEAGSVYRQPVISMDITATAVALAGADATGLEGVDLVPFVTGKNAGSPHEALFWRCRTRSNNYGARQGDWKYVYSTEGGEQPGPNQKPARDMLFNLADDIGEQRDLAAQHSEKLAALKKLYEDLERRRGRRLPQAGHRAEDERLEPETHREEASKVRIHPSVA